MIWKKLLHCLLPACLVFFVVVAGAAEASDPGNGPSLNSQETRWLAAHDGKIRIGHAPDWPPMDFKDKNGIQRGMVVDYIALVEEKLGISFVQVNVDSWAEILVLAKNRELDMISAGQETEERKRFMYWSTPYLSLDTTIIVKKDIQGSLKLDEMEGMTIGVPREYAIGEFIRANYPNLLIVDVVNPSDGINKVSFGEIDAMVTEVPNALYVIDKEKITNLRLAGVTKFQLHHGIGIRNDWSIFSRIIEKTLASISEEEHQRIHEKWVRLDSANFYETRVFWYTIVGTVVSALLIVGFVLLWNRTLKNQVMQRTEEVRQNEVGLEALLELYEHSYSSIQEIIEHSFELMLRLTHSRFGYLAFDDQEGLIYVINSKQDTIAPSYTTQHLPGGLDRHTIGFWGDAVRRGKPVISNNYSVSNPGHKGVPTRYGNITRYMNVPIFSMNKVVVVAGMGNKESEYTSADLRQLNLLAQGMWRLIQRKQAEQAIQKSEKRFRDLVENSPNGIVIIQDGMVVYKNSKQVELTGELNIFDLVEKAFVHKDDVEKTNRFIDMVMSKQPVQTEVDFRFYLPSERDDQADMRWVTCILAPIEYQDRDAILIITIDITSAKELERLLVVQDKMASLGHVSAGIAHEIRNPLSGININLRTIEKNYTNPEKQEKVNHSIEAIRTASRKIESVIRRVMNFAKPMEPKFNLVDINLPLRESIELTSATLRNKGISLIEDFNEHIPKCYAEPHLIEEVVLNLINNASEALMGKEGEKSIRVSSTVHENRIFITVEDNGNGIPSDLMDKIFEPFFTTKDHSTGIGLSLCHRIIIDHNGTLTVSSSVLGGAKFVIQLPAIEETN